MADKFNVAAADVTIQGAEYTAIETEVGKITKIIDDALDAGGLTQLDTANLKAIRSSVADLGKAFASIGEIKKENNDYKVVKVDFEKVSKALENISKAREEVGASATKALASSKAQAENIGEMMREMGNRTR